MSGAVLDAWNPCVGRAWSAGERFFSAPIPVNVNLPHDLTATESFLWPLTNHRVADLDPFRVITRLGDASAGLLPFGILRMLCRELASALNPGMPVIASSSLRSKLELFARELPLAVFHPRIFFVWVGFA